MAEDTGMRAQRLHEGVCMICTHTEQFALWANILTRSRMSELTLHFLNRILALWASILTRSRMSELTLHFLNRILHS